MSRSAPGDTLSHTYTYVQTQHLRRNVEGTEEIRRRCDAANNDGY